MKKIAKFKSSLRLEQSEVLTRGFYSLNALGSLVLVLLAASLALLTNVHELIIEKRTKSSKLGSEPLDVFHLKPMLVLSLFL